MPRRAPGAWEDFVDRFLGVIVHVIHHTAHARTVTLSPDDVDDLAAEVFVTLLRDDFRVLRNFRGQSSLSTYLTVVSRRVAVKEIARRRKAEAMGHVVAHQAAVDAGGNGQGVRERTEKAEVVRQLIERLDPREARVVEMFYLEGHGYRRISVELGIPENSVGPILSRAREQMNAQVEQLAK
ncbi:MAG: sigma-70 family RNA polymerase sigma factor [Planctomycetaceae bacterium]